MGILDSCRIRTTESESESGSGSEDEQELAVAEEPQRSLLTGISSKHVLQKAPILDARDAYFDYEGKQGPWSTCFFNAKMEPRVAKVGVGGSFVEPTTLMALMTKAAAQHGEKPALKTESPCPDLEDGKAPPALPEDEWTTWTYQEMLGDIRSAAKGMIALGFQQYDTVNIWGFNSPEWVMGALAAGFAGGKVAGLYPTDTPDTAAYKVVHSGGTVIIVEDKTKIDKIVKALAARGDCKKVRAIVAYGFEPSANETVNYGGFPVPVISWSALLQKGAAVQDAEVDKRIAATDPGHCAALIYTSGTTGEPKAVMISHDNIIFESSCVLHLLEAQEVGMRPEQERILSYLPLSHVAGMMVDIVTPVVLTSASPGWMTLYFARNYDLKAGAIKDRLIACKPTIFLGVPLVWEKIADKMRALGAANTGVKKHIADWAKGLGLSHSQNCQLGGSGSFPLGYGLADTIVLKKVKAGLGLDCCKFGFTGAAPIRVDTLEYFGSLGLGINEVYGMSECTGACTFSLDKAHAWGSCGFSMPGIEVKAFIVDPTNIDKKVECPRSPNLDDQTEHFQGELCFRGRNIMMGYMACNEMGQAHVQDIMKKNGETIDSQGWLHSGDKGMITEAGMVKITGRYKELIIGEGGENIAPVPIEDSVKKACDGVAEIMMVGDKRKYNVALVTLKALEGTDTLDAGAKRLNPAVTTIAQAMDDPAWIKAVTDAITAANKNGKVCPNNAFKIQKFCILPVMFSEEKGELTPTKKLKRKVVETGYAALIDKMYATDGVYIRFSA
jgi:long-chain-fatty-acid--CoA ligase ACSBG